MSLKVLSLLSLLPTQLGTLSGSLFRNKIQLLVSWKKHRYPSTAIIKTCLRPLFLHADELEIKAINND